MEEYIILWEPQPVEKPEFRLYYDDHGRVICYSCGPREEGGNFVVISSLMYAEGRPDLIIIDGEVTKPSYKQVVSKLMPVDDGTFLCTAFDMSIIVDETFDGDTISWKMKVYEL